MLSDIQLICFDLDDTLWPCMPTIRQAESAIYSWLQQHKKMITDRYSQEQLRARRIELAALHPDKAHDLSFMRKLSLSALAQEFDDEPDWIDEAFNVFYQARQQVTFYDDVEPVLKQLKHGYRLAAATNGNADIWQTSLRDYFDCAVSAAAAGALKPDPAMFYQLLEQSGLNQTQVAVVGDHPVHDIEGAQRAGLRTIWLNRQGEDWPLTHLEPDYTIENLYELLPTTRPISI